MPERHGGKNLNPDSRREGLDKEMNAFLDYLQGKVGTDGLVKELEAAVERARAHKEWEVEYMTWQAYQMDARREGMEEGMEKGIKGAIAILRDIGHRDAEIKTIIMDKYGLTEKAANDYL